MEKKREKTSGTVRTILYTVMLFWKPVSITQIKFPTYTNRLHICRTPVLPVFHYHFLPVCCSTLKKILGTVFTHSMLICDALYSMMPFALVLGEYFYSYNLNDFVPRLHFKGRHILSEKSHYQMYAGRTISFDLHLYVFHTNLIVLFAFHCTH